MRSDLAERVRRRNELARLACGDGDRVWGGWVWTAEPPEGPACVRLCRLEDYEEYRKKEADDD